MLALVDYLDAQLDTAAYVPQPTWSNGVALGRPRGIRSRAPVQTRVQKPERVYEEGCDRGAFILVTKQRNRSVNARPREFIFRGRVVFASKSKDLRDIGNSRRSSRARRERQFWTELAENGAELSDSLFPEAHKLTIALRSGCDRNPCILTAGDGNIKRL
jgi:hypothetical protein